MPTRLQGPRRRGARGNCHHAKGHTRDDAAFPGVHPNDLALCQRVDTFAHSLVAVPAGELLELDVR